MALWASKQKGGVGDGLQCYTAMTTRAPAVQRKAALQRRLGNMEFKYFWGNLVFHNWGTRTWWCANGITSEEARRLWSESRRGRQCARISTLCFLSFLPCVVRVDRTSFLFLLKINLSVLGHFWEGTKTYKNTQHMMHHFLRRTVRGKFVFDDYQRWCVISVACLSKLRPKLSYFCL